MIKQINLFKCLHLPLNTSLDELTLLKCGELYLRQEPKSRYDHKTCRSTTIPRAEMFDIGR